MAHLGAPVASVHVNARFPELAQAIQAIVLAAGGIKTMGRGALFARGRRRRSAKRVLHWPLARAARAAVGVVLD